jgi:hypothetical protein
MNSVCHCLSKAVPLPWFWHFRPPARKIFTTGSNEIPIFQIQNKSIAEMSEHTLVEIFGISTLKYSTETAYPFPCPTSGPATVVRDFFKALQPKTGWSWTVIGGGPTASKDNGAISVCSYHIGSSADSTTFGEWNKSFDTTIAIPFHCYCHEAFRKW